MTGVAGPACSERGNGGERNHGNDLTAGFMRTPSVLR
jgi:hypothetical protein